MRLLHEELNALLRDEVADAALQGARFTSVELSVDYRNARVRFALPREPGGTPAEAARIEAAERGLERATAFLRANLADALELKRVPTLRFVFDGDADASAVLPAEPDAGFEAGAYEDEESDGEEVP